EWVVVEDARYRLSRDLVVRYDVERFEALARRALARGTAGDDAIPLLEAAVGLYRDHFLHGESAGFWRDEEQDRLRRLYADAGTRLAELQLERGELDAAVVAYERVIAREPLHEPAHRGLIACWDRGGNRARAIQHFQRFAAALQAQLESEPGAETIALYEAI